MQEIKVSKIENLRRCDLNVLSDDWRPVYIEVDRGTKPCNSNNFVDFINIQTK